jgi:hypothetical protein
MRKLFCDEWPLPFTTQIVDSGWTHLETGEPLMYSVQPHEWREFVARFPHLDKQYSFRPDPPPPPPGFGTARQANDYRSTLTAEQRAIIDSRDPLTSLPDVS